MVQPRAVLHFVLISSACVPPVTSRRAVDVDEQSLDEERDQEQQQEQASTVFPGKTHLTVDKELLVRECVAGRARDWPELHARLGLNMSKKENMSDTPLDLVIKVFKLKDNIEASLANHTFSRMFKTDETMAWEKDEETTAKQLLSYRFDFDTAFHRCAKGSTDLSYECMTARACPNHTSDCKSLEDIVKQRIDASDLVEHLRDMRSWYHDYSKDEAHLWEKIKGIDKNLSDSKYSWTKAKHSCRKHLEEDFKTIKQRVLGELSASEAQEDGACHEKADMMCPEGTYPTTQRRWNHAAGAGVFGTAFLVAKFTFLPVGGAIGTALAGPMGGTVGLLAASAFITPVALASGYWVSRGPMECACFPRECMHSNETKTCEMRAPDEEKTTKNPWGDKLPMPGMKCTPRSRVTWDGISDGKPQATTWDECELQQCRHEDYANAISGHTNLWGIAGLKGKTIYNCLSVSQSPAGMLAIAQAFPDGRPNTITERNKVFTEVSASGVLDSEAVAPKMNWDIVNFTGCQKCHEHEAQFCMYAGNPGCGGTGDTDAVTFDNIRDQGCFTRPVLTIPVSYMADIADLQAKGADLAKEMLNIMLRQGFREYRDRGHSGPVRQCFHLPSVVSVHWLHLHSFCLGVTFDGMPGDASMCRVMAEADDADQIAGEWSTAALVSSGGGT